MMQKLLGLLLVAVFFTDTVLSSSSMRIENFPGMSDFPAKQYHGYLNVTDNNALHYWLIESQNDPEKDPLILWLSGGPGCSSLFALFTEIGPYMVAPDGKKLLPNPYSWNKIGSLLFFESPVGVGYSYAHDEVNNNDNNTCTDHYEALLEFFKLYPHYKGLVIGNGLLDLDLRFNTFIPFAYHHGFIDESAWERAKNECCHGDIDECDFIQFTSGFCKAFFDKIHHDARYVLLLHRYNMYTDCTQNETRFRRYSPWPIQNTVDKLTCAGITATAVLLNRDDVRDALLIPRNAPLWKACGDIFKYQKIYKSVERLLKGIISNGVRVLLHYGDLDLVCNFLHGEKFAKKLGFHVSEPKEAFTVNGKHGGFITKYNDLEVAIINGAGHMVPTDKPDVALYLLEDFIKGSTPIFSQITKSTNNSSLPEILSKPTISSVILQHHRRDNSNSSTLVSLPQKNPAIDTTSYEINADHIKVPSNSADPFYDRLAIAIMLIVAELLVIIFKRL
uniref:Carboxypeptidase n=1 Tax=Syphacia muris TaxID=451379 RepID=A0A158R431_9BILA